MKIKKQILILTFIVLVCFSLLRVNVKASIIVNYDPTFSDPTKWEAVYPQWNDYPTGNPDVTYATVSDGVGYLKCIDTEGWDWSDAVLIQGKKIHESGYYQSGALPNITIKYEDLRPNLLTVTAVFKINYLPEAIDGIWYPFRAPSPHIAGAFCLAWFEMYMGDMGWTDINNPDYWDGKDCIVIEKANRWCDNSLTPQVDWGQVDEYNPWHNFFLPSTTHDSDYHDIRAGWMFTEEQIVNKKYVKFRWDIGVRVKETIDHFNVGIPDTLKISKVRLTTIGVSVETYLANYSVSFDSVYFEYNPNAPSGHGISGHLAKGWGNPFLMLSSVGYIGLTSNASDNPYTIIELEKDATKCKMGYFLVLSALEGKNQMIYCASSNVSILRVDMTIFDLENWSYKRVIFLSNPLNVSEFTAVFYNMPKVTKVVKNGVPINFNWKDEILTLSMNAEDPTFIIFYDTTDLTEIQLPIWNLLPAILICIFLIIIKRMIV